MWRVSINCPLTALGDLLFPATLKGIMIDYKKLGRVLDSGDQQKVDTLINVDTGPLISQYDRRFERHGFIEVKDNKYHLKMRDDARSVFQITKSIALDEINWLVGVITKLLSDDTAERLKKEIDLVREDAQVQILLAEKRQKELMQINKEHQKLNGQLREEIEDTKKEADKLMMNKIIKYENQLNEVKADNKKLAETVDRITHTPDNLRKKAVF